VRRYEALIPAFDWLPIRFASLTQAQKTVYIRAVPAIFALQSAPVLVVIILTIAGTLSQSPSQCDRSFYISLFLRIKFRLATLILDGGSRSFAYFFSVCGRFCWKFLEKYNWENIPNL
jgi:hypothetical protein